MRIKEILKKQGELYKNLTSNKTIEKHNETIKPNLVSYRNNWISKQECDAMKGLEKLVGMEPVIVNRSKRNKFEISINNNKVIYLGMYSLGLKEIPESINNLQNLEMLNLFGNDIQEIKNLNNLTNLERLYLHYNQIQEIKGLDNLTSLKVLWLGFNLIENREYSKRLRDKGTEVWI